MLALFCALVAAPLAMAQGLEAGKGELRILVGFPAGGAVATRALLAS